MKKTVIAKRVGLGLILAFGLMLARPPVLKAALNAYIKIQGIDGESDDRDHEKWSDLLSFSWGTGHSSDASKTAGGGGAEKVVPGNITITKAVDRTSPKLADLKRKGITITSVIVDTERKDGKPGREITTLKHVKIASLAVGAGGKTEKVRFAYQSYSVVYTSSK
jgi:type VI secretion system secreted protein Hcp